MTAALVLLYHGVTDVPLPGLERYTTPPAVFRAQLAAVRSSGRPLLTFAQLVAAREAGTSPHLPVVVTIDDGFADAVQAVHIAAELGVPGSLFVTTSLLGRPHMLRPDDLDGITEAGWEVGSHGVTHRRLDELGAGQVRQEVGASRLRLQEILAAPVTSFAYPHGNHSRRVTEAVRDAGYTSAAAVRNSPSPATDSRWAVSRITVSSDATVPVLKEWLRGDGAGQGRRTSRWLTRGYRVVRQGRARLRGGARDELADVLLRAGQPRHPGQGLRPTAQ